MSHLYPYGYAPCQAQSRSYTVLKDYFPSSSDGVAGKGVKPKVLSKMTQGEGIEQGNATGA